MIGVKVKMEAVVLFNLFFSQMLYFCFPGARSFSWKTSTLLMYLRRLLFQLTWKYAKLTTESFSELEFHLSKVRLWGHIFPLPWNCLSFFFSRFCYLFLFYILFSVEGDCGNIGGSFSHEYHYPAAIGEDTLLLCQKCGTATNAELLPDSSHTCSGCGEHLTKTMGIEVNIIGVEVLNSLCR